MQLLHNLARNFLHKPITKRYPFEPFLPSQGVRGQLEMNPNSCTYCSVCEKKCPTGAITVTRKPNKSWTLRPHQCIICGYCVEICPKDSLSMNRNHRLPTA
jgi:ech hydrogenase subunit F